MSDRPRILVLEGATPKPAEPFDGASDCVHVRVENLAQGLALLAKERFDGIYLDTRDSGARQWASNLLQSERCAHASLDFWRTIELPPEA